MPKGKISSENDRMLITIPKVLKEKFFSIASDENRSASNLAVTLMSNYVKLYEQKSRLKAYHDLIMELNKKDDDNV